MTLEFLMSGQFSLKVIPRIRTFAPAILCSFRISNLSLIAAALVGGFFPAYRGARESILESIWG